VKPRKQQATVSSVTAAAEAARSQVATARTLCPWKLSALQPSDVQYRREYQRYSPCRSRSSSSINWRPVPIGFRQPRRTSLLQTAEIQAQRAAVAQAEKSQANIRERQAQLQYYRMHLCRHSWQHPVKVGELTSTQLTTITQNRL